MSEKVEDMKLPLLGHEQGQSSGGSGSSQTEDEILEDMFREAGWREVVAGQQKPQIVGSSDVIQIQGNNTIIIKGKLKVIHEGRTVLDLSGTEDNAGEGTNQAVTTGRCYVWWEWFMTIWTVLLCLLTPVEVGFLFGHSMKWLVVLLDWATCVIGTVDLCFAICLCGGIHRTPNNRCYESWQGFLTVVDLVGCLPWIFFYEIKKKWWWLKTMSILRVFRVRKVYNSIQRLKKGNKAHYHRSILVGLSEILCVLIFFIHLEGCLLYYIAAMWPNPKDTWIGAPASDIGLINEVMKYYIPSVYFAMVTFTTVGYGDSHAVNELEKGFVTIALIFNFSLVVYLNGRLGLLLAKMESKGKEVSSDVHFQES